MKETESPARPPTRGRPIVPDRLTHLGAHSSGRLGPLLAWAVVYADIGTSIYYVPGILFTELGKATPSPAAAFVLATGLAVILLALKYVDVSGRYPDGGGVVSVASDAFSPTMGALGGVLICISYFLTGAISAVSGFQYLAGLFPVFDDWLVPSASGAIVLLGVLNYIGIRESAIATAFLALAAFVTNLTLLVVVGVQLDGARWQLVLDQFRAARGLPAWPFLVGYAGSWLAYSGLESISQIAPALKPPRENTALKAMMLVMGAILLTSPLTTAFETALLRASEVNPERFMFELGVAFGPRALQLAIVFTSSVLLMGAANTAIIGCYHVFLALVRLGYLPHWFAGRNARFNTPHRAIVVSVLVPVAVIVASNAKLGVLGHMYTFGLLGAFTLTSVGLDKIKWQERARGAMFWLGLVSTVLVAGAWVINMIHQKLSTVLGAGATVTAFALAHAIKRGWIGRKSGIVSPETAEREASELQTAHEILTVEEALEARAMYQASTMVAVRGPNLRLLQEALARARGGGERTVYLIFVDEIPGLFFPPKTGPSKDARDVLATAVEFFKQADMTGIPVWRMAHDAGASLAGAARKLGVDCVMVGTSQRTAVWHLLRGSVLKSLIRELSDETRVWICN